MALVGNYQLKTLSIPDAYWRIHWVTGSKEKGYEALIVIYQNAQAREDSLDNMLFAHSKRIKVQYVQDEIPQTTIYNAIKAEYPHLVNHP